MAKNNVRILLLLDRFLLLVSFQQTSCNKRIAAPHRSSASGDRFSLR